AQTDPPLEEMSMKRLSRHYPSCASQQSTSKAFGSANRAFRVILPAAVLTASALALAASADAASKPRWVLHVERYPGGISNGVRASLDAGAIAAQNRYRARQTGSRADGSNVQMNDDSFPQMPQNEESVAYSTDDPLVAVAAANDYISGGVVIMRTKDGGRSW